MRGEGHMEDSLLITRIWGDVLTRVTEAIGERKHQEGMVIVRDTEERVQQTSLCYTISP